MDDHVNLEQEEDEEEQMINDIIALYLDIGFKEEAIHEILDKQQVIDDHIDSIIIHGLLEKVAKDGVLSLKDSNWNLINGNDDFLNEIFEGEETMTVEAFAKKFLDGVKQSEQILMQDPDTGNLIDSQGNVFDSKGNLISKIDMAQLKILDDMTQFSGNIPDDILDSVLNEIGDEPLVKGSEKTKHDDILDSVLDEIEDKKPTTKKSTQTRLPQTNKNLPTNSQTKKIESNRQ